LEREPAVTSRRDDEGRAVPDEHAPQAISERLLAVVTLERESEHVVRRAWRSAQRLDGVLDVLIVRPPGREPNAADRDRLESLRRLTSMLGARLRVEEGEDAAAVAVEAARSLGSTYVLIAAPPPRRGLARLRPGGESLLSGLLEGLPGVDVRIVADPSLRAGGPPRAPDKDLLKTAGSTPGGGEGTEHGA